MTLVWLFLVAQRQDQQGEAAIAPLLAGAQDKDAPWSTQLLDAIRAITQSAAKGTLPPRDLADWPPARTLLETIKKDPRTQRERAVQLVFFMSQLATNAGERGGAMGLLQLEAKSYSTSVPEDLCARTELRKAGTTAPADLIEPAR